MPDRSEPAPLSWLGSTCRLLVTAAGTGAGAAAFVPRGTEHSFRVISDHPSRQLVILTPGGFEGVFAEMAAGRYRIPEDMAEVAATGARFNISFTGPPLMAG